jgi:hypothetical protein
VDAILSASSSSSQFTGQHPPTNLRPLIHVSVHLSCLAIGFIDEGVSSPILRCPITLHSCSMQNHSAIPTPAQLSLKLRGHDAYYGVTNHQRSLQAFREQVRRLWRKWLSRRNRRDRVTSEMFARLEKRFPRPIRAPSTRCTRSQPSPSQRNRMRSSRTFGSVGARGEQSPRATRPG